MTAESLVRTKLQQPEINIFVLTQQNTFSFLETLDSSISIMSFLFLRCNDYHKNIYQSRYIGEIKLMKVKKF